MKNVLIISYFYPPLGGVGIIRTLKFSKYLRNYGWTPHVLSVNNRDLFYTVLSDEIIPDGVRVYRSWNILNNLSIIEGFLRRIGISGKIFIPDAFIGWIPLAIYHGKKIIQQEEIDLIYVSCPPFSSALIGMKLKEQTGVPLILDFRDSWTLNPYTEKYLVNQLGKIDEEYEKSTLNISDVIITATDGIKSDYCEKYPSILSKIRTIPNGFDLDDIPNYVTKFEKFTIAYTGYFYGIQSPKFLFTALKQIIDKKMISEDEIQFIWAGRDAPSVRDLIIKYSLEGIVNYIGLVPKNEADKILYRSHLLFFVLGDTREISQKGILSNKIFPYLASGRPILAVIPNGSAEELIRMYSDDYYIIRDGEVERAVNAVLDAFVKWKLGENDRVISNKTADFRKRFNYETFTQELVEEFNRLYER